MKCHEHFGSPSAADLHDPHGACLRPHLTARKDGNPVFAAQQRKDGIVWVRWSTARDPQAVVALGRSG
jgi:hypothetical protein